MSGKHGKKPLGFKPNLDIQAKEKEAGESKWTEFWKFLKEYYELDKKKADTLKYIQENPMKSTVFLVTLAMCAIPIIFFLMFVLGSFIFTLMGFLIFEGSILAIGAAFLGVIVFVFGSIGVAVSVLFVGGYKGFQLSSGVWTRGRDILASLPIIRNYVTSSSKTE